MKRIALYGGVFDPVHNGHLAVIEQILSHLQPDELLLIPCGNPPHKKGRRITDGTHRAAMLHLATKHLNNVTISNYELKKETPSYTVETLEYYRSIYGKQTELIWVVGADNITSFSRWYQPNRILELANIAVLTRPGFDPKKATEMFGDCYLITDTQVDISSTQVRENIKTKTDCSVLIPPCVEEYIRKNNLYPPTVTIETIKLLLQKRLREHRLIHTLGVCEEAIKLANRFGASKEKAELAALLHDWTKQVPLEEQQTICNRYHSIPDEMQKESVALLHAVTAETIAFYELGIDDNEILSAIRYHTTGCRDMNLLMKIIYLADCIEPNREPYPGLEEIRATAQKNLDKAVLLSMERGLAHLKETGKPIHPDTLSAIKGLKGDQSMNSKELMALIVKALDSKKAKDIEVLSMEGVSDIGDYFIIATGNSTTQIKALADAAEEATAKVEIAPHHQEGYQTAIWILQDYGDVVLHIFNTESRGFYSLEHLWADATRVDITEFLTQDEGGTING